MSTSDNSEKLFQGREMSILQGREKHKHYNNCSTILGTLRSTYAKHQVVLECLGVYKLKEWSLNLFEMYLISYLVKCPVGLVFIASPLKYYHWQPATVSACSSDLFGGALDTLCRARSGHWKVVSLFSSVRQSSAASDLPRQLVVGSSHCRPLSPLGIQCATSVHTG